MSLAGVFGATAAMLGATTVVRAAHVRLTVRRRRRERARRRRLPAFARTPGAAQLSSPLRGVVDEALVLAELLEHARRVGDVAWANAMVTRESSSWSTPARASEHAPYVAAVGDAMRSTSSFLSRLEALPSADAELFSDRGVVTGPLRRLLTERRSPAHYAEFGDDLLGSGIPEAIDEMERLLDAALHALERLVEALTSVHRRPYR